MIHLEERNPMVHYVLNIDLHSHWKERGVMLDANLATLQYDDAAIVKAVDYVTDVIKQQGITILPLGVTLEYYQDTNTGLAKSMLIVSIVMPNDMMVYDKLYNVSQALCQDCIAVGTVKGRKVRSGFLCGSYSLPYGHFTADKFSKGFDISV